MPCGEKMRKVRGYQQRIGKVGHIYIAVAGTGFVVRFWGDFD